VFVCVRGHGEPLLQIDADMNAAQNLQRRFWTRHAEAFRLPCVPVMLDGTAVWVPRQLGKRLLGALGGVGLLRPTGHASGSCRWESVISRKLKGVTGSAMKADNTAVDPATEELLALAEEADTAAGKVEVFFRDPSGVVLPVYLWFPAKAFWGVVRSRTQALLKERLAGARDLALS
jgi:hypothetical protein